MDGEEIPPLFRRWLISGCGRGLVGGSLHGGHARAVHYQIRGVLRSEDRARRLMTLYRNLLTLFCAIEAMFYKLDLCSSHLEGMGRGWGRGEVRQLRIYSPF